MSVATNALWGVCNAFLLHWGSPDVVNGLVKTLLTGVISLVIFFFLFQIIFPDNEKLAKKAKRRYEKLTAANASAEKLAKAEARMKLWKERTEKANAEKEYAKAKSQVNAKVMGYFAMQKAEARAKTEEKKAEYALKKEKNFADAVAAIKFKEEKEKIFLALK